MLVTLETSHLERSPLNVDAWANMRRMLVTLDTSQLEISPLNLIAPGRGGLNFASKNNWPMSVTADTSHDPIGPYGPLEQSVGDSCRQSEMAAWSSALDLGAHPVVQHCRGHRVGLRMGVRIMIRVRVRVRGLVSERQSRLG